MVVQKLRKAYTPLEAAIAYFSILSVVNKLELSPRELQLLAFTSLKGGKVTVGVRETFCEEFKTSKATINNLLSQLKRTGLFIKRKNMFLVNPSLVTDFTQPLIVQVKLDLNEKA
jgi:predicted transcriptional regulator